MRCDFSARRVTLTQRAPPCACMSAKKGCLSWRGEHVSAAGVSSHSDSVRKHAAPAAFFPAAVHATTAHGQARTLREAPRDALLAIKVPRHVQNVLPT
ncbi:hypothetical protein MRX96_028252 [Rhipicephalus microplus]